MDEFSTLDPLNESTELQVVEATSVEYLGRWNRLVSTTNWEKGRIISQWRAALADSDTPQQACSDEAWAHRVSNVSSQHVGRLRRVWDRFGQTYENYQDLYWSHFQAAVDWDNAEMWLEGAVQNGWSINQMRSQRWETIGAPADQKPSDGDIIVAEFDEDSGSDDDPLAETADAEISEVRDVDRSGNAPADQAHGDSESAGNADVPFDPADASGFDAPEGPAAELVRPFENLPRLPDDLNEAFESFKMAVLNHKLAGWKDISRDDVLVTLDALKHLALAPSEG